MFGTRRLRATSIICRATIHARRESQEIEEDPKMKISRSVVTLIALALTLACSHTSLAQQPAEPPDMTIDADARSEVINGLLKKLNDAYVFPEVAKKMEQAIRDRVQKKEYDSVTSALKFAETLTTHLQEVSHDKHLRVSYSHDPILPESARREPSPEERERYLSFLRSLNFGFEKVERLSGNVGYLDLRGFLDADLGGETVVAAMNFVANTDALIIDLRHNGGGSPAMVALISSYLFNEPTHLNDLYWREGEETHQWWTSPYVPGKRYGDKDVYILTSNRTFSAAEEFTYNLKNLKRATIVGETTGGGAHPGGPSRINSHFAVWVPRGRAINPISKTNWEGVGVEPDVKVPANEAFKTAHLAALNKIAERTSDQRRKDQLKSAAQTLQKELDELRKNKKPNP
jgi:C-terminal processing protease CtpA/Prc